MLSNIIIATIDWVLEVTQESTVWKSLLVLTPRDPSLLQTIDNGLYSLWNYGELTACNAVLRTAYDSGVVGLGWVCDSIVVVKQDPLLSDPREVVYEQ